MTEDDRELAKESIGSIATDRIADAVGVVSQLDVAEAFEDNPQRRDHAREFQQQALALLSDAVEAVENTNAEGAVGVLKATTTYLEAIQDLLVGIDHYETADMLGQAIENTRQAKTLLNVYIV